jgi:hypothetical protein
MQTKPVGSGSNVTSSAPPDHQNWKNTKQEVLGSTNLPTFPMAMVAIVTLAKDCM